MKVANAHGRTFAATPSGCLPLPSGSAAARAFVSRRQEHDDQRHRTD
jgi:hypothetical protein